MRFERMTPSLGGTCSIQLSYGTDSPVSHTSEAGPIHPGGKPVEPSPGGTGPNHGHNHRKLMAFV